MASDLIGIFVLLVIACPLLYFFSYLVGRPKRLEDKQYQKVEIEIKAASLAGATGTVQQPGLSLMNVMELTDSYDHLPMGIMVWTPIRRYDIKDADNKLVVGRIRGRLNCPKCGSELDLEDYRNCHQCGAHARIILIPTIISYVYEGIDGAIKGTVSHMEHTAWNNMHNIFDAEGKLLAEAGPPLWGWHSNDLRGSTYRIFDPKGKVLAEYHGDRLGEDYRLVTPSRTVVAHVRMEPGSSQFHVYAVPEMFDSFLVLMSVVLIDILKQKLAYQRVEAERRSSISD